jgi:hypothetical protein
MSISLKAAVEQQRTVLTQIIGNSLSEIAMKLAKNMHDRQALERILFESCDIFIHCKYLYVMNADGVQITSTMTQDGPDESQLGRDRSLRPYMAGMFGSTDFRLSDAYISRRMKRPSLTAIQVIRDEQGNRLGFLGVDYDLRELPRTGALYKESREWRQIKGDPAIRGSLFGQSRVQSPMDDHMEDVFSLMEELMLKHGVFHGKFHFSSSRATIWLVDDPYDYRILTIEDLTDPDTCLAYPVRPYFERAIVPENKIIQVFRQFGALRFADETIYLRGGSLNIVNGMIGLNFSCDGSHYLPYDEFLEKGLDFWFGV